MVGMGDTVLIEAVLAIPKSGPSYESEFGNLDRVDFVRLAEGFKNGEPPDSDCGDDNHAAMLGIHWHGRETMPERQRLEICSGRSRSRLANCHHLIGSS